MKYLRFDVIGQSIKSLDPTEDFMSNTVDEYGVHFNFSDDWEGYGKTVVFQMASYYQSKMGVDGKIRLVPVPATGAKSYPVILVGDEATVPWEVLKIPGTLKIGVYGVSGTRKKPTIWANTVQVWPGTTTENDGETNPPSPSSYDILASILSGGHAGEYIYKKSDDDLDFGWDDAPKGEKGDKGDPGKGISSIAENVDGSFTITFSDGTRLITSSMKGEKGDKGDIGTTDYHDLENIPTINNVLVNGSMTGAELGLLDLSAFVPFTNAEIDEIWGASIVNGSYIVNGTPIDISDATATQDEICLNRTAYIATGKTTGTGDMVHTLPNVPADQDTSVIHVDDDYYVWRSE